MARRYGPDGKRLWDGKAPEAFTERDTRQFLADTTKQLESEDFTHAYSDKDKRKRPGAGR